ncbi:MAG: hypothetical protein IJ572_04900 [Bacilli bacterium]|nr:hypothetical protein [Bacilli bacterium]
MKKIKNLTLWLILIIVVVLIQLILRINESINMHKIDFSMYENMIKLDYDYIKDILIFTNNTSIVHMSDIQKKFSELQKSNDFNNDLVLFSPPIDKNLNMCLGYFIIQKDSGIIKVDASHMCDLSNE